MNRNVIVHGDCVPVMRSLPDECIDLTVTSPPYGDMRTYGGDVYDWNVFIAVAHELKRITKPGGVVCWHIRNQVVDGRETLQAEREKIYFDSIGLGTFDSLVVESLGVPMAPRNHYPKTDATVYVLTKGKPKCVNILRDRRNSEAGRLKSVRLARNKDGTTRVAAPSKYIVGEFSSRTTVWRYACGGKHSGDPLSAAHPARMVEKLAEDLIISYSRPGELVFDPFCGSGTTPKMAMLNGRDYLGVEIYNEYVTLIRRRMTLAKQQRLDNLANRKGA